MIVEAEPKGFIEGMGNDYARSLDHKALDALRIPAARGRGVRTMRRRSRRSRRLRRYRDNGGATDQRTQLSTACWPCAPNSRWQLSFMRCMGSSRSQAVKGQVTT